MYVCICNLVYLMSYLINKHGDNFYEMSKNLQSGFSDISNNVYKYIRLPT